MKAFAFFLFLLSTNIFCQDLRKVVEKHIKPTCIDTFYVLKANSSIRQGTFRRSFGQKSEVKGQYENNKRTGVWEYYRDGVLVEKYDFTLHKILFEKPHTLPGTRINYETANEKGVFAPIELDTKPFFAYGNDFLMLFIAVNARYPLKALKSEIEGRVIIRVDITSTGQIIHEQVIEGVEGGCSEEALRVVQMIPDDWVAGVKNGKEVTTRMIIPVKFEIPE